MKTRNITNLIFCLFVAIISASCSHNKKKDLHEFKFTIIKIDGCEYIQYNGAMGYKHIEHKGNCQNTIHFYNKLR